MAFARMAVELTKEQPEETRQLLIDTISNGGGSTLLGSQLLTHPTIEAVAESSTVKPGSSCWASTLLEAPAHL